MSLRSGRRKGTAPNNNSLHEACQRGKVKKVKELLEGSAVVEHINVGAGVFGYTPLHEATSSRKPEIMEMLLQKGANENAISNGRYTPLHIAASIGDLKCIEMLLKYKASVRLLDEFGKTPHRTAELNHRRKAARLLKTAEVKYAVCDNKEFARIIEDLQPCEDVTATCFDECLEVAVQENYHFAAGFIILREPDNIYECFKKSLLLDGSRETAAMLLICIAAQIGDLVILKHLCESDTAHRQQSDVEVNLKRDFFPAEGLNTRALERLRAAVKNVDHAFPVSLACNKQRFDAVKILLFNLYCSETKKEADWHGLALSSLSENWIVDISSYKRLYLGWNHLAMLPMNMECLVNLVRLDLQHNRLTEIPGCILELPVLRNLNISYNMIQELPAIECWTPSLNIFEVQGNYLNTFPENIDGATIQYLNLSSNKLDRVPPSVCQLTSLHTLNISGNKDIRELPILLGNLSKLVDLNLKGLQISDPPAQLQKNTKNLISHLRAKLRAAEPYYTMKLLLIGKANHGKTTLLHRLKGNEKFNDDISTQGIDIQELQMTRRKTMVNNIPFTFRVWDFAGQEEYYATHQCFLSKRSLYLLIWDTRSKEEGVQELKPWLDNLATRVPYSTVIVVGTFMDKVDHPDHVEFEQQIQSWIDKLISSEEYYSKINVAGIANVSSNVRYKDYRQMIEQLKTLIYNVAEGMTQNGKEKGDKIMGEQIPLNYKLLEKELDEQQAKKLKHNDIPIMTRDEFLMIAHNLKDPLYAEDVSLATSFLHNIGTLLHYDDPNQDLKDLYFINPSWLCRLMAKIITVKQVQNLIKEGVLQIDDLRNFIIRDTEGPFPNKFYEKYLRLLYRFQIACQIDNNKILVPSQLPEEPKAYKEPKSGDVLLRYHLFSCIPFGFWERLISRLLLFMREMLSSADDTSSADVIVESEQQQNKRASFLLNIPTNDDDIISSGEESDPEYDTEVDGLPNINCTTDRGVVYINVDASPTDNAFTRLISLNGQEYKNSSSSSTGFSTTTSDHSNLTASITSAYAAHSSHSSTSSYDARYSSTASSPRAVSNTDGRARIDDTIESLPAAMLEKSHITESCLTLQPAHELSNSVDNESESEFVVVVDEPTLAQSPTEYIGSVMFGDNSFKNPDNRSGDYGIIAEDASIGNCNAEDASKQSMIYEEAVTTVPPLESMSEQGEQDLADKISAINGIITNPVPVTVTPASPDHLSNRNETSRRLDGHSADFTPGVGNETSNDVNDTFCETDIARLLEKEVLMCWKNGVVFKHPRLFFSVKQIKKSRSCGDAREKIETKVSNTRLGYRVLGFIIDHIRTLIKEWYPGLSGNDGERPFVNQYIACPVCTQMNIDPPHLFDLQEAFKNIYTSKNHDYCLPCGRSHEPRVVNIDSLCPELLFKDLTKTLQIDETKLEYQEHEDCYLGKGGYGVVYRGKFRPNGVDSSLGTSVAVKVYSFEDHVLPALDQFHDVRQEIFILSKLRDHPSIVQFVGFVMRPRLRAVMELANFGNLKELNDDVKSPIPRLSLFKISQQVASGLDFMHRRRVIHRDIKPDNILVFSIIPNVMVKISDFGTANFLEPIGMKSILGTHGFMAPEMYSYTSSDGYTTKVDIYSFAMVLYELITKRRPFYEYQKIVIPEALKRGERPGYSDIEQSSFGLLPLTELMVAMWNQESTRRPTAHEVMTQLHHPAFKLFYGKRVLDLPQNPRFICAVPSMNEVWIVCDDKKGTYITILDMATSTVKETLDVDGGLYGLPSFNIVQIALVDDDHVAVILRGTHDVSLIFSADKKNVINDEEIEDDFVKSIMPCGEYVFLGYQSGVLLRVLRRHFIKGKMKESMRVPINNNRAISSIICNDHSILLACGGYMYMCPKTFTSSPHPEFKFRRPHGVQYIQELLIGPDKRNFFVSFQCLPEVHMFAFETLAPLTVVNFGDTIKSLNSYAEPSDLRATSMCAVYDVLWIGTGSGHIMIYSIDSESNDMVLLTTLHPYKMELRKLLLWKVDDKARSNEVEYLVISTGKELNPDVFGSDALCPLKSSFPDERSLRRPFVKPNLPPPTVTSFYDILPPEGKIILIWQAVGAEGMKKLLSI